MLNTDTAFRLGSALGVYFGGAGKEGPIQAVIGRDTRESGPALCSALAHGLNAHGVYVRDAGIVPTPAVAYSVLQQKAAVGIAVTASHNPAGDNGIKLFGADGCKLDESQELKLETLLESQEGCGEVPEAAKVYPFDAAARYVNYIRSLMSQNCMEGWKVVLDLANGATSVATPAAFRRWGAELHLLGDQPDGRNINEGLGSEHPEVLAAKVREVGANLGVAHDGDGDRLVVCDDRGELLEGEVLLGLLGVHALSCGTLKKKTLVTTVHSNMGLDRAIREAGGRVERTAVGDRNVAARMRAVGANLGGESSGHIIFSDFLPTGDGLLAVVKLIEMVCRLGQPLSQIRRRIRLFPQQTRALPICEKPPLHELPAVSSAIGAAESALGDRGRVLVRYSGTEPILRLLVEAREASEVRRHIDKLEAVIRGELGIIDS